MLLFMKLISIIIWTFYFSFTSLCLEYIYVISFKLLMLKSEQELWNFA